MESSSRIRARLNKLKEQKATALVNRTEADTEVRRLDKSIGRLKKELTKKTGRKVTDHAIVRYLERIMGVDIKELERTILDSDDIERIEKAGQVVTITIRKTL